MNLPISGLGSRIIESLSPSPGERETADPKTRRADPNPATPTPDWTTDLTQEAREADSEGPDPRLWALLTHEERAFFMGSAARGPATYAPTSDAPAEPAQGGRLGARIDVRI